MRHGGAASLATGRAAIEARHLGVRRCFVDEDGPSRIGADSERSGLVLPRSILPPMSLENVAIQPIFCFLPKRYGGELLSKTE
jgi:hypothetical protein